MKHTGIKLLAAAAAFAVGALTQAHAVTWTFMENGSNMDLGVSSSFTSGGYTVTAYGFTSAGVGSDLFSKLEADPTETGLGLVADAGNDHEIDTTHFVQIDSHIVGAPPATIGALWLGSIQSGETGAVYGSNTLGSLGTWLGNLGSNGNFGLGSYLGTYRYFGVTDVGSVATDNTLITSLSATVPDGGTTSLLLGLGLISLALIRRKRSA